MGKVQQTWNTFLWWQKSLTYATILLFLYTLLGFILVPQITYYVLEKKLAQSLDRNIQVAEVRFNPFTLTAQIAGFSIQNKEASTELAGFDSLHARLGFSSLVRLALVIYDVHLDAPRLNLALDKDGQTNIKDLTTTTEQKDAPESEHSPLPLIVEPLNITNGTLTFEDQNRGISHILDQINFSLPKFSSRQKDWETFMSPTLSFCVNGAPLHLEGRTMPFSHTLRTEFDLQAAHLTLPQYWTYAMARQNLQLLQGELDIESQLVFEQHENKLPTFSIQGQITGQNIKLVDAQDQVLFLPQVQMKIDDISILNQHLKLGSLNIEEPFIKIVRHKDQTLNWATYFTSELETQNATTGSDLTLDIDINDTAQKNIHNETTTETTKVILDHSQEKEVESASNPQELPLRVQADSIQIHKGQIVFNDESTGFEKNIQHLDLTITDFDTAHETTSKILLDITTAETEEISIHGTLSLAPLAIKPTIEVTALDLPSYGPYFQDLLPLTLAKAKADLVMELSLEESPTSLQLNNGKIQIHDLLLNAPDQVGEISLQQALLDEISLNLSNSTLSTGTLTLSGLEMRTGVDKKGQAQLFTALKNQPHSTDTPTNSTENHGESWNVNIMGLDFSNIALHTGEKTTPTPITISSVQTGQIAVNTGDQSVHVGPVSISLSTDIVRRPNGELNLLSLLGTEPQETSTAKVQNNASPWTVAVEEIALVQSALNITDQSIASPLRLEVDNIAITAKNISTDLSQAIPLEGSCRVEKTGIIQTAGTLTPKTMVGQGTLKLSKIPLPLATNYIRDVVHAQIQGGRLAGNLTWNLGGKQGAQLAGSLQVDGLQILESTNKKEIFGLKTVDVRHLAFGLTPLSLRIDQIHIVEPRTTMTIDPQGQSTMSRIFPPAKPSKKQQSSSSSSPIAELRINSVNLKQGQVVFLDESIAPAFQTTISPLDLSLNQLSLDPRKESSLILTAIIDDSASLHLEGTIAPLKTPVEVNSNATLRNLDLTALSPYAAKFIAYPITQGQLNWDVQVLAKENALNMGNKITAQKLELGDKVESANAIDAPVKLGLALLRDVSGNIAISLPIKGDLNDPKLSIGGIVVQAFVGLIIKAVASPFTLLAALIPEGSPPLDRLQFSPGLATATPKTLTALTTLADILDQRPGMSIVIQGQADPKIDQQGLADLQFYHKLQVIKFDSLSRKERDTTVIDQITIADEEFGDILWEAYKKEPVEKDKNALGMHREVSREIQEEKLRERIVITDADLMQLASSRAQFVQNYLLEQGVAPERLTLNSVQSSAWSGLAEVVIEIRTQENSSPEP